MNRSAILALTLAFAPTLVSAQQTPLAPPGAPGSAASMDDAAGGQRSAAMQQMHQQMRQMHEQARSQILAAISAQHRSMVSNIIGGLAVANTPDPAAAARQIDAVLSPGEKQAILNIHTAARASMRNLMESQRAQFEASATPEQRAKMQQRDAQHQAAEQSHASTNDAGTVVVHMLGHMGGPGEGMHRS